MDNNKNENYLNDVKLFKLFINDISNQQNNENKINYNDNNFWNLIFLLSRSYLNDNFHKLFDSINNEYLNTVFSGRANKEDFLNNIFLTNKNEILKLLLENQNINIEPATNDYKFIFKIIRNHLAHYNYEIKNNIIIINNKNYNIKISIASLVLILLATLSNFGQSQNQGASDSIILGIKNNEYLEIKATKKNNDTNTITPGQFVREEIGDIINNIHINTLSKLKKIINTLGIQNNLYIKFNSLNENHLKNIETYLLKNNLNNIFESKKDLANLYYISFDEIRKTTITFKFALELLYIFYNKLPIENSNKLFIPVLKNSLLINYLNIVFCSYAVENNTKISNNFFEYLNPNDCDKIPLKIRNSLAHCHYKFENILDNSSDIIIEFWDEWNNVINFECKIKKSNIEKLIENFITNIKNI